MNQRIWVVCYSKHFKALFYIDATSPLHKFCITFNFVKKITIYWLTNPGKSTIIFLCSCIKVIYLNKARVFRLY